MKRGLVAVKEVIFPIIGIRDLPDELIWELFAWAYRFSLQSVEELNELLEMRTISPLFRRLIDRDVIPSITFLCGEVLRVISPEGLRHFTGLGTMLLGGAPRATEPLFPQITRAWYDLVPDLRHLKKLVISAMNLRGVGFGNLPHLEMLKLSHVEEVTDEQVGKLVTVRDLSIDRVPSLSERCLDTLPLLVRLVVAGWTKSFTNLNRCEGLRELIVGVFVAITDDGVAQLTNLTSLSIPGSSQVRKIGDATLLSLPQLRILNIANNATITDEAVSHLVTLERLDIRDGSPITLEAVVKLTNLVALDVGGNQNIPRAIQFAIPPLPPLKELYMGNLLQHLQPSSLPNSLTSLALSRETSVSTGFFSTLPNLTYLYLGDCAEVWDDDLRPLAQLRVLDLSHNDTIGDFGLETLTNLTELILWDNQLISADAVKSLANLRYLFALDSNLLHEDVLVLRQRGVLVYTEGSVKGVDPFPPHFRNGPDILLE
jgi:Leucine-rich repeat (LRR) protein